MESMDSIRNLPHLKNNDGDAHSIESSSSSTDDSVKKEGPINNQHPENDGTLETERNYAKPKQQNNAPTRPPSWWSFFRCCVLDLPLLLLCSSVCLVFFMRSIWTDYYIPIMDRARRTDDQLLDEYTYYERSCTVEDVTTGFTRSTQNTTTTQQAMETMLTHGAVILPDLLQPDTIVKLKRFVQYKNKAVTDDEAYPVSQGYKRVSYGIEATEDEIVMQALQEITSHWLLPDLLQDILGVPDPALTELTAITAYYGCDDQVIHSDTKSDGYAAQFARTYSHSYSLFIPLQNVTPEMGVTQVCPGTHYCTNDMEDVCSNKENLLGVHQAFPEKVWPAGQGAMINQQIWHGGSAHVDPYNPERILFIVSFIARPQLGKDTRQLARGTYFHMKWNMWGGTFQDIANAASSSMVWPFNILRSLAIWKPPGENWGYNLLLSSVMRAANEQGGMEVEDLETFVSLKMDGLFHFPKWLQGQVSDTMNSNDAWRSYIQETIDNTLSFLTIISTIVMGVYLLLAALGALISSSHFGSGNIRLSSMLLRPIITHGAVAGITWLALNHIRTSPWGANILSGKTLMRPFPGVHEFTTKRWENDPAIPVGRTTLPDRMDILFGTRYDADYLGSYNRWLDFHPGNRIFRQEVSSKAYLYPMYEKMEDPLWLRALVHDVADQVRDKTQGGRILKQDHLSGDWVVIPEEDALETVRLTLATESNVICSRMHRMINFLIAENRFGYHRGTVLALESTILLQLLRDRMFGSSKSMFASTNKHSAVAFRLKEEELISLGASVLPQSLQRTLVSMPKTRMTIEHRRPSAAARGDFGKESVSIGSIVMVYMSHSSRWSKGTVVGVQPDGSFDIAYADGTSEESVTSRRIRKHIAVEEGVRTLVFLNGNKALEATVTTVSPNGFVSVELDNGTFLPEVSPEYYQMIYPPFEDS